VTLLSRWQGTARETWAVAMAKWEASGGDYPLHVVPVCLKHGTSCPGCGHPFKVVRRLSCWRRLLLPDDEEEG
jgi:hypothetical protein